MSPRALGTGLAAAAATLLLASPAGAVAHDIGAPRHPSAATPTGDLTVLPALAFGSFDNTYDVAAGGTVTDSLGALGADDLLVYETLTVGELAPTAAGTLVVNGTYPTGTFTFTAADRFSGTASASYVGETADGEQLTASVVFDVAAPANRAPVARPDRLTITAGSTATVQPLANDDDPDDGDLLTLTGINPAASDGVSVAMAGTAVRVRATRGAEPGTRQFRYTVADRAGATATGVLTVVVRSRPVTTTTTTAPTRPPSTTPPTTPTAPPGTGNPPRPTTTRPTSGSGATPTTDAPDDSAGPAGTVSSTRPDGTVLDDPSTIPVGADRRGEGAGTPGTGTTDPARPATDLPTTGSNAGSPVLTAVVLVALGLGFVALAGRRRLHGSR